jgi:hypothetical protein
MANSISVAVGESDTMCWGWLASVTGPLDVLTMTGKAAAAVVAGLAVVDGVAVVGGVVDVAVGAAVALVAAASALVLTLAEFPDAAVPLALDPQPASTAAATAVSAMARLVIVDIHPP